MRAGGILMHITSLSSPYGIGTMGREAYEFVDFLKQAGQKYWQLLPLCPTGYGDSPYQSTSTFAGNPYLIDLTLLQKQGLLTESEIRETDWETEPERVDYELMYQKRFDLFQKAVIRFLKDPPEEYQAFLSDEDSFWLEDYALFMALKTAHGGAVWNKWEKGLRLREKEALHRAVCQYADQIDFWKVLQYFFHVQFRDLKLYANSRGIRLIGDLPIYVAYDSADVWARPEQFVLDKNGLPREVAGCPPDGFSEEGQLWGNPLFDWDRMKKEKYAWWVSRIRHSFTLFDVLRIDHFRGFAGYYAIPFGQHDARRGTWKKGPGMELFEEIRVQLGEQKIIAEDLGFMTSDVKELLNYCGFPGMKVLEFAFDSRDGNGNEYRPYKYPSHSVAYVGTHDNDTACGWMKNAPAKDRKVARDYLHLSAAEGYHWGMMRGIWASPSELAIVQAQDILGLGSEARMNIPSTLGGNWVWRAGAGAFSPKLAARLRDKMLLYGRLYEAAE